MSPKICVSLPILPFSEKVADHAAAPRNLQIDAAHRFAVVARHRAELQVELEVADPLLLVRTAAADRRLDEAAAIEHVAAHRHLQRAVLRALCAQ